MRCGECNGDVSPWAARCSTCGASIENPIDDRSADVSGRRTKRRHGVVLVVALLFCVFIAVVAALRVASSPSPRSLPTAPASPEAHLPGAGVTLVYGAGPLTLARVGSSGSASYPGILTAGYPVRPIPVGDGVVYISDGQAEAISLTLGFTPLGPATSDFASSRPGWVWLVGDTPAGPLLHEVRFDGAESGPESALPKGTVPIAAVGDGVLLRDADHKMEIWNPADRTTSFRLGPVASLVDARGRLVVFTSPPCGDGADCDLHVVDVGSRQDTRIKAPPGTDGFVGGGAISPDGAMVAAFVGGANDGTGPTADLVLVDLRTGTTSGPIGESQVEVGEPVGSAAWSPSGKWLFFCGLQGPMHVYAPGEAAATALPLPSSYAFTATESAVTTVPKPGSPPTSKP